MTETVTYGRVVVVLDISCLVVRTGSARRRYCNRGQPYVDTGLAGLGLREWMITRQLEPMLVST
jgi:hypothetical protein